MYPRSNHSEIPEDLQAAMRERGIRLQPVDSVAEALATLFESPPPTTDTPGPASPPERRRARAALLAACLLAAGFTLAWIHGWPPFEGSRQVRAPIDSVTPAVPVATPPATPVTLVRTPSAPADPADKRIPVVSVRLQGGSEMAARLARLIRKEMEQPGLAATEEPETGWRIRGTVRILELSETPDAASGKLRTKMKADIRQVNCENGPVRHTYSAVTAEVEGTGEPAALLASAARALAERLERRLQGTIPPDEAEVAAGLQPTPPPAESHDQGRRGFE